jgi:SAM-dependent methyltransferase
VSAAHGGLDGSFAIGFSRAMQFAGPADDYDRFMGRYTPTLAVALADAAEVSAGMRVVDVGCGPGGLAAELAVRVGGENVAAIDPAARFAAACRERVPRADVREGVAEELPWSDATFDAALSSLVIGFMRDPDRGVREMARITRPGGTVAACMWDLAGGGMTMLRYFWEAMREVDHGAQGESGMAGAREGDIADRLTRAGLQDVAGGLLTACADYSGFEDFWHPLTLGVGPAGQHLQSLSDDQQSAVRAALRAKVPDGPFTLEARAWYARGTV